MVNIASWQWMVHTAGIRKIVVPLRHLPPRRTGNEEERTARSPASVRTRER